jgi:uncharacterized membrane protein YfhO
MRCGTASLRFRPNYSYCRKRFLQARSGVRPGGQPTSYVEYRRPDSDQIECTVTTNRPGYLRIIESWDPGWSAIVDGLAAPIVPAFDALLAVPIDPGRHEVRFVYRTPGAMAGQWISVLSFALLCGLVWSSGTRPQ